MAKNDKTDDKDPTIDPDLSNDELSAERVKHAATKEQLQRVMREIGRLKSELTAAADDAAGARADADRAQAETDAVRAAAQVEAGRLQDEREEAKAAHAAECESHEVTREKLALSDEQCEDLRGLLAHEQDVRRRAEADRDAALAQARTERSTKHAFQAATVVSLLGHLGRK